MYATIDDLKKAVPESMVVRLSDDEALGGVGVDIVQEAIDSSGAEIDGYIGERVVLPPAAPYPLILVKLCVDIAVYNLYSRLMEDIPETRKDRYDAAIRFLERFAGGDGYLMETAPSGAGPAAVSRDREWDFCRY